MKTDHATKHQALPALTPGENRWRLTELVLVFVLLPGAIAYVPIKVPLIPVLWGLAAVCVWLLWRDRGFERKRLWNAGAIRRADLMLVLVRFAICAALLAALLYANLGQERWGLQFPPEMFIFPQRAPWVWLFVMVVYPIASVIPQNIVWRAFFFHRYRGLFGGGAGMLLASAITFGWVHVVMLNWFAVVATLIGGLMFAQTYRRSGSMLLASIEHALYGCWVFTVGYGLMFLYGTLPPEAREMMQSAAGS